MLTCLAFEDMLFLLFKDTSDIKSYILGCFPFSSCVLVAKHYIVTAVMYYDLIATIMFFSPCYNTFEGESHVTHLCMRSKKCTI